jgi:hypothetical protein
MSATREFDWPEAQWFERIAMIAGCAGVAGCALGAVLRLDLFFHSYLFAFTSWLAIALGSLAIWMIHNLTGGYWGLVLRRFLEAATRTLPFLLLAFLPIAFMLPDIYPWARSGNPGETLEHNPRPEYLNVPFFLIRAGVYFACWLIIAFFLNRWSRQQDHTADPETEQRMHGLSGPGLVIYGMTVTFAAIDWIMSLQPNWSSTIFGAIVATGQMLPALALAIAFATWFASRPPLRELVTPDIWNDLGNLLLAFVMLWTYMMFSQLLLIWSGNLPEEITWYLVRIEGGWLWVGVLLAVFYFALPFLLLLSRDIKREPRRLRIVALTVVAMSFVHQYWMIAPVFSPEEVYRFWMDIAAFVGLGGFWMFCFFWQLQTRPLIPLHLPAQQEEVAHHA